MGNKIFLGIIGVVAVAAIAVIAVVFATGLIGGDGASGDGTNPQDFILEDASFVIVQFVIVQNVAAILQTEFPDGIPQQMLRFEVSLMPSGTASDLEDADECKQSGGCFRGRYARLDERRH